MKKYKTVQLPVEQLETMTCDVCKKDFDVVKDILEVQEFTYIHFRGGYDSVFGDSVEVKLDICQHCLKEKLGEYVRIEVP